MVAKDRQAVICDLAETYHIFPPYSGLSVFVTAMLAAGLPASSRIKKALADTPVSLEEILLARIVDNTMLSVWLASADGARGRNRPKSVLDAILKTKEQPQAFDSGEELMKVRRRIMEGASNG